MEDENFHFGLQRMVKELQKEQHITKYILQALNGNLLHKKKGLTRVTNRILYERVHKIKNWTNIFLFFEEIFSFFLEKRLEMNKIQCYWCS